MLEEDKMIIQGILFNLVITYTGLFLFVFEEKNDFFIKCYLTFRSCLLFGSFFQKQTKEQNVIKLFYNLFLLTILMLQTNYQGLQLVLLMDVSQFYEKNNNVHILPNFLRHLVYIYTRCFRHYFIMIDLKDPYTIFFHLALFMTNITLFINEFI